MEQTEIKQYVTKDMVIGDILKKYPDVAVVMLEHGLHCVGCHANVFDTVEAGSKIHGLSDDVINNMVDQMNKFIAEDQNKKAEPAGPAKISITEVAASKVKELMAKEKQEGYGLRVGVVPGGCSGSMYQMNFEKEPAEGDVVIEANGVKLFIEKGSVDTLRDVVIDYVDTLNESGFKLNNPNADKSCGCGKSFG